MATGIPGSQARAHAQDLVHFISAPIDGTRGAQTVQVGILPAGAAVIDAGIIVATALNGAATVNIGTAGTPAGIASGLVATAVGQIKSASLATMTVGYPLVDTPINAVVAGPPTVGLAYAWVAYIIASRAF
jgi:hypothetical protein